jgi:REP element-mobilizing transposase RayT
MGLPKRFHKPDRLAEYDYSSVGSYFVTIVTRHRDCCLGRIEEDNCVLTAVGETCRAWWEWLPAQYKFVRLGESVIMPNHIHGIITLHNDDPLARTVPLPLGKIIAAFKTKSTTGFNRLNDTNGVKLWQDGFHDRIIRGNEGRSKIAEYIRQNPLRWSEDEENPNPL